MSDRWQEMAVFVRVAETGSLSRAGRDMMLSQPSMSRIVGALEARLGTALLLRTTRSISLTEAGSLYLDRARTARDLSSRRSRRPSRRPGEWTRFRA